MFAMFLILKNKNKTTESPIAVSEPQQAEQPKSEVRLLIYSPYKTDEQRGLCLGNMLALGHKIRNPEYLFLVDRWRII